MTDREAVEKMTAMLERTREQLREPVGSCCCEWGDCLNADQTAADQLAGDIDSLLSKVPGPRR